MARNLDEIKKLATEQANKQESRGTGAWHGFYYGFIFGYQQAQKDENND